MVDLFASLSEGAQECLGLCHESANKTCNGITPRTHESSEETHFSSANYCRWRSVCRRGSVCRGSVRGWRCVCCWWHIADRCSIRLRSHLQNLGLRLDILND